MRVKYLMIIYFRLFLHLIRPRTNARHQRQQTNVNETKKKEKENGTQILFHFQSINVRVFSIHEI